MRDNPPLPALPAPAAAALPARAHVTALEGGSGRRRGVDDLYRAAVHKSGER
ncbi:hypothetical protein ACFQX4_23830 [Roseomonas sp. GCM10028921]